LEATRRTAFEIASTEKCLGFTVWVAKTRTKVPLAATLAGALFDAASLIFGLLAATFGATAFPIVGFLAEEIAFLAEVVFLGIQK